MTVLVKKKLQNGLIEVSKRIPNCLDLVHTNLCEFEEILTCGGNVYLITFIDDSSQYTYVYLLKNKSGGL